MGGGEPSLHVAQAFAFELHAVVRIEARHLDADPLVANRLRSAGRVSCISSGWNPVSRWINDALRTMNRPQTNRKRGNSLGQLTPNSPYDFFFRVVTARGRLTRMGLPNDISIGAPLSLTIRMASPGFNVFLSLVKVSPASAALPAKTRFQGEVSDREISMVRLADRSLFKRSASIAFSLADNFFIITYICSVP